MADRVLRGQTAPVTTRQFNSIAAFVRSEPVEGTTMNHEANKLIASAKMDALYQAAKASMPDEVRRADLIATVRKVYYDASMRAGFTADEALQLCMMRDQA